LAQKRARGGLADERVQLGGCTVVEGSIHWDEYRHRPDFTVTDGERVLRVRYTGSAVLPDTFKDRAQVVLEGRYLAAQDLFDAKVVFAKCPSKYEGQDYQGHVQALDGKTL
jgi:cytochrome c-type biogenesis protein CcmE